MHPAVVVGWAERVNLSFHSFVLRVSSCLQVESQCEVSGIPGAIGTSGAGHPWEAVALFGHFASGTVVGLCGTGLQGILVVRWYLTCAHWPGP